jgi:hypothetical protein
VKKQIREYLNAQAYINEFYQVPAEIAAKLLKTRDIKNTHRHLLSLGFKKENIHSEL